MNEWSLTGLQPWNMCICLNGIKNEQQNWTNEQTQEKNIVQSRLRKKKVLTVICV